MTAEQVTALGPAFTEYLGAFRPYFGNKKSFAHLATYCRGLISDLARKSVEPIALLAGTAVRTLQQFLTDHVWDQDAVLARLQRRIVERHLPAPGQPAADDVGTVGIGDETSQAKKGDMTPGVQRQYCGSLGKVENCIVTVHLAVRHGAFLAMLDSDLYIPDASWDQDRDRCAAAHIPEAVAHRPKWVMAIEQVKRAIANGVRFDWLTYDEGYGGKPEFLFLLEGMGQNFCCEVPANSMCWPTYPTYDSHQRPHQAKRVDNAATWGKPPLETLLRVAFSRWGVEHAFRLAKTEVGFGHFEGRSWLGLLRHMVLCQLVLLFVAEQTGRLRGEKPGCDDGAGGPGPKRRLPSLAQPPPRRGGRGPRGRGDPPPPAAERRRPKVAARVGRETGVAL